MFEIAIYKPKYIANLGLILRSAHCFRVDAVNLIGHRYGRRVPTDTMNSSKHIPINIYDDIDSLLLDKAGENIIAVEVDGMDINNFTHPENGIYVFGGENVSVPSMIHQRIKIETKYCINVAMAVSIVCFHRGIQC